MIKRENIAKMCHEVNRAYCESVGDYSQKDWKDASTETKLSAITGVDFALENPDATPEDQHNQWMKEKMQNGWTFAIVKDSPQKFHPNLVNYTDLSHKQKAKDRIFQQVVKSCMTLHIDTDSVTLTRTDKK